MGRTGWPGLLGAAVVALANLAVVFIWGFRMMGVQVPDPGGAPPDSEDCDAIARGLSGRINGEAMRP